MLWLLLLHRVVKIVSMVIMLLLLLKVLLLEMLLLLMLRLLLLLLLKLLELELLLLLSEHHGLRDGVGLGHKKRVLQHSLTHSMGVDNTTGGQERVGADLLNPVALLLSLGSCGVKRHGWGKERRSTLHPRQPRESVLLLLLLLVLLLELTEVEVVLKLELKLLLLLLRQGGIDTTGAAESIDFGLSGIVLLRQLVEKL